MNCGIGGALDGLRRGQLAVLLQHPLVGQTFDGDARVLCGGYGAYQIIARTESPDDLGHNVRVQARGSGHPVVHQALQHRLGQVQQAQFGDVQAACPQGRRVDDLVTGTGLCSDQEGGVHPDRVFRRTPQGVGKFLFQLGQVPLAVRVGGEVAELGQALGHTVEGPAALAAQDILSKQRHRVFGLGVQPPLGFQQAALDTPHLGDGHKQRIDAGVDRTLDRLRRNDRRDRVVRREPVGQELPGTIDRLGQDLLTRLHLDLGTAPLGLALELLDLPATAIVQPLHIAQATGLQRLDRLLGGLHPQGLILREGLRRHTRLLRGFKQRHHAAALLGQFDFLGGGQHAVEHPTHLVGEGAGLGVGGQEGLEVLVHIEQPGPELLEIGLQLDAGGPALEQIGLEGLGGALVIGPALLKPHTVPLRDLRLGRALDTVPGHQPGDIVDDLLLAGAKIRLGHELSRQGDVVLEEKMSGFMQEGGQVGLLEQRDEVGRRIERAAGTLPLVKLPGTEVPPGFCPRHHRRHLRLHHIKHPRPQAAEQTGEVLHLSGRHPPIIDDDDRGGVSH